MELGTKEGSGGVSLLTSVQAWLSTPNTLSVYNLLRVMEEAQLHVPAEVTFNQLITTGDLDLLN